MKNFKILLCSCQLAGFLSKTSPAQTVEIVPRFEKSDCAVAVPKGERVECGFLIVRENRSKKSEKTIRLPIVILKSDDPRPKPDPVLRTLGGPGGSSLRMITGRRFAPWLKKRDMIVFEQRGTKYAQPALDCPEVSRANIESFKRNLDQAAAKRSELDAARVCRERLVRSGVDLEAYNSAESAADIEDLRRALRLEKINLYGVSYSARLMLNVVRDYPAGVRSLALESTMPLEINYDEVGVDNIARTLALLFSRCRADPGRRVRCLHAARLGTADGEGSEKRFLFRSPMAGARPRFFRAAVSARNGFRLFRRSGRLAENRVFEPDPREIQIYGTHQIAIGEKEVLSLESGVLSQKKFL